MAQADEFAAQADGGTEVVPMPPGTPLDDLIGTRITRVRPSEILLHSGLPIVRVRVGLGLGRARARLPYPYHTNPNLNYP